MLTKNKKKKRSNTNGLNKSVLKRIKGDTQIVADIIRATGKSYPTVMRWLDENSELLTTAKALKAICEGLQITQEEALAK